jgi:hypothetical protein
MSDKDKLQNMLDNLINQKPEQAQVDFHDYLQGKMQDVMGTGEEQDSEASKENPDKE